MGMDKLLPHAHGDGGAAPICAHAHMRARAPHMRTRAHARTCCAPRVLTKKNKSRLGLVPAPAACLARPLTPSPARADHGAGGSGAKGGDGEGDDGSEGEELRPLVDSGAAHAHANLAAAGPPIIPGFPPGMRSIRPHNGHLCGCTEHTQGEPGKMTVRKPGLWGAAAATLAWLTPRPASPTRASPARS